MSKSKTPGDDITVPLASELNPHIAEIETKRLDLGARKNELQAESRALAEREGPTDVEVMRANRVAEILGQTAPQRGTPSKSRRQEIAEEIRDIDEALDVLRRDLELERNRASATARERLTPAYRSRVKDLCDALCAAHTAQIAIQGLAAKIHDAGLSTSWLWSHQTPWLDTGPHGTIGRFVHDARKAGIVSGRDIPAELRDAA